VLIRHSAIPAAVQGARRNAEQHQGLAHKPCDRVTGLNPFSLHQVRSGPLHSSGASKVSSAQSKQQQPQPWPPILLLLLLPGRTVKIGVAGIAVTLMTRVLQAPSSNLGRDTAYTDCLLHDIPQSLRENFMTVLRLDHSSFLPNISKFTIHLRFYYSILLGKFAYVVQHFQFLIYYEEMFSYLFPM
jgi:hypothetical protein